MATLDELYAGFLKEAEKGERPAKDFLLAHLKEFPQELQDIIIVSFVEAALDEKNNQDEALAKFQGQIIKAFHEVDAEIAALEKRDKLLEIKEDIKK